MTRIRINLADYNFEKVYKKGSVNANADTLKEMLENKILAITRSMTKQNETPPFKAQVYINN